MITKFIYSGDVESNNNHWDYCRELFIPYMVIRKDDKAFYTIDFDLLTCNPISLNFARSLQNEIEVIYDGYVRFLTVEFPFQIVSGGLSASIRIIPIHCEYIANELFDYLLRFIKNNQVKNIDKYNRCISGIFKNGITLREVFDVNSAEYLNTQNEEREGILKKIVDSEYNFKEVISGYCEYFKENKPHVLHNLSKGIDYNYNYLCKKYPNEDDLIFDDNYQAPVDDKIVFLEEKLKEISTKKYK